MLLEPGLSMYLPTGTPHAARAQETVSLHVTLGINQLTWRGLVERTVAAGARRACPTTTCPPATSTTRRCWPTALADRLEELAAAVRRVDATAAVEDEIRRFLTTRPPRLAGGLHDVLGRESIDATTRLRRRPGHPCVLLDRGDQVEVLLGDRTMTVPARIRPALDEVRARGELTPADLPLDPQSSLVLCRRLVREGPAGDRVTTFRCAADSLLRDEPVLGTATHVRTWLLLEHVGPWGDKALRDARLPDGLGAELQRRAAEHRAKILLIRRYSSDARRRRAAGLRGVRRPGAARAWRPAGSPTRARCSTSTSGRCAAAARAA